jgi:hypothetical protein
MNAANANEAGVLTFDTELIIPPNGVLYVDIQNTTGGTVTPIIICIGIKTIGQ